MSVSSIRTVLFDLAPSLETVDVTALARIDRFIARAVKGVNEDAAGDEYDEAVALKTWHTILLSNIDGTGEESMGQLTEDKADNASTKYAVTKADADNPHGDTVPGRRLDNMMRSWVADPMLW